MTKDSKTQTIVSLKDKVSIDRRNSGDVSFSKDFAKLHESVRARNKKVRIYVDRSVVDVFANDGLTVLSERVFPADTSNGIELAGERDAVVTFTLWKMGSAAR
jgi:fructan beta-fructosidase